jgi:hypothetical protein
LIQDSAKHGLTEELSRRLQPSDRTDCSPPRTKLLEMVLRAG